MSLRKGKRLVLRSGPQHRDSVERERGRKPPIADLDIDDLFSHFHSL